MLPLAGNLWATAQPNGIFFMIDRIARVPISTIVIFSVVLTILRFALFAYLKKTPIHMRSGGYGFARVINDISDALIYAAVVVFMLVRPFGIQTFFIPTPSMVDTLRVGDFIVANKFVYRTTDPKFGEIVVFKPPVYALNPGQSVEDTDFIKRCLGVPGDIIEMKDWQLYRNGTAVDEPYKVISDESKGHLVPLNKDLWGSYIEAMPDFKLVEWPQYQNSDPKNPGNPAGIIPLMYRSSEGSGLSVNVWNTKFVVEISDWQRAKDAPPAKIPDGYYLMVGDNRNGSSDARFWGLVPRSAIIGKAEFVWMPIKHAKKLVNPHAGK